MNNCFIDTTWYLPGQNFPRTIISTDRNSAEYFKIFDMKTHKMNFQKIGVSNYNLKDKTVVDIVKYIQNVSQTYDMEIYFFNLCRSVGYDKPDDALNNLKRINDYIKHEFYIHHLNLICEDRLIKY